MPYATNDDVRIYYETDGTGPPLMLYTGFTGVVEGWADFGYVDALRDDYRLIMLDPRGHGASDKPHDPAAYAFETRVADVVAVLDAEGVATAHLWGYSEGALMGVATARYAPQRLRSIVLGGWGVAPQDAEARVQLAARLRARGAAIVAATWERGLGELPARFRARLLAGDAEALAASRLFYAGTIPDLRTGLARITVPTLVYCGRADDSYAEAQAMAAEIPHATFVMMGEMTHLQGYAQSEAILPQVRAFLAETEGVPHSHA